MGACLLEKRCFWSRSAYIWISGRILGSAMNYAVGDSSNKGELGVWHLIQHCNQQHPTLRTHGWESEYQFLVATAIPICFPVALNDFIWYLCSLFPCTHWNAAHLRKHVIQLTFPRKMGSFECDFVGVVFFFFSSLPLQPVSNTEPV